MDPGGFPYAWLVAGREIYVIDRVITRPGCAKKFVDAYLSGYAPGARERGMTLQRVLVSPPIWFADHNNTVTIIWSLPTPQAWWEMTWQGRSDAAVGQWWAAISDLIVERSRSVAADAEDVDGLCDV
jgi:uncharacterized membrane protein YoaT (DUF817 family)